jgi:cytochrome c553
MRTFRSTERHNDINGMMRGSAANISDEQIEAVASFIQGLRP